MACGKESEPKENSPFYGSLVFTSFSIMDIKSNASIRNNDFAIIYIFVLKAERSEKK